MKGKLPQPLPIKLYRTRGVVEELPKRDYSYIWCIQICSNPICACPPSVENNAAAIPINGKKGQEQAWIIFKALCTKKTLIALY
jgi:hypothetical protein